MVTSMQGALARRLAAAKDDLITEYFRRTQAADEAREHETSAAVRIQSRWRAHITRSLLAEWNGNALHIERVYRGHLSRVAVNAARRERRIYWQRIYFSHCATSIQKWFRAYHSRRYKHNYYARKAYIEAVVDKSEQLRKQLEEALHAQVDEAIAAQEQKARAEVQALSAKLHHLVSTKQAPGIYNSPMHDGFLPTAFSIPIEQHLRNAIKPQVREEMRRSSKGKLTNTKPQLSLAAAARASDPYISAEEQRRLQERASRSAFVAGDFSTATKHGGIFSETRQSIQAGSPYVDAGKQQLSRTVSKPSWVSSKPFHTAVPSNKLLESQ